MARSTAASKPVAQRKPRATKPKTESTDAPKADAAIETPAKEIKGANTLAEVEAPKAKAAPREVSPENQATIDRILAMRRSGKGLPTIAKTLNEEGVPTFGKGDKWHPPVVRGICLRNGVERGTE